MFDAFSSREPVSTSLENALTKRPHLAGTAQSEADDGSGAHLEDQSSRHHQTTGAGQSRFTVSCFQSASVSRLTSFNSAGPVPTPLEAEIGMISEILFNRFLVQNRHYCTAAPSPTAPLEKPRPTPIGRGFSFSICWPAGSAPNRAAWSGPIEHETVKLVPRAFRRKHRGSNADKPCHSSPRAP